MCPPPCDDCGYLECTCDVGCGDCGICEDCKPTVGCEDCKECGCADCFPPDGNCGTCEVCDPPTPPCECGTCDECDPPCSAPHYPDECDIPGCPNATLTVNRNVSIDGRTIVVDRDGVGDRDASQTIGNIRNAFSGITDAILKNRIHAVRVLPTGNSNLIANGTQYTLGILQGKSVLEINNFLDEIIKERREFTITETINFGPAIINEVRRPVRIVDKTNGAKTLRESGIEQMLREALKDLPNVLGGGPATYMMQLRMGYTLLNNYMTIIVEQPEIDYDYFDIVQGVPSTIKVDIEALPWLLNRDELTFQLGHALAFFAPDNPSFNQGNRNIISMPASDQMTADVKKIAPALNRQVIRNQNAIAKQS